MATEFADLRGSWRRNRGTSEGRMTAAIASKQKSYLCRNQHFFIEVLYIVGMTVIMDKLPPPHTEQNYPTVHPLSAGFLTLPEKLFVHPAEEGARNTVPSLSFLVQHRDHGSGILTRIVFDLGLRRDLGLYPKPLQKHLVTRQPIVTDPDAAKSLELGGLSPELIDMVILSHVHWDHTGTPKDFPASKFIVGNGSLGVLRSGADPTKTGSHAHYEPDLLPLERTIELSQPGSKEPPLLGTGISASELASRGILTSHDWRPIAHLPNTLDLFSDGSVYIIDAPGHLEGHVNLMVRTGPTTWVYLAGDACHDRRLMSKELGIATWDGADGQTCCIHVDKALAEETIDKIGALEKLNGQKVEVILAHDIDWLRKEENRKRFWPNKL